MRYHLRKDLLHWRNEGLAIGLWLAVPLTMGLLMTIMGSSGSRPVAHILIADQDNSLVSQLLAGAFGQGPISGMFQVEKTDEEQGRQRINHGDASALLVIPRGFGQAVLENTPTQLLLLTNPAQRILPKLAETVLHILIQADFYLQQVFGTSIHAITQHRDQAPDNAQVAEISTTINQSIRAIRPYLSPPLLDVRIQRLATEKANQPSLAILFLPGLAMMAALFAAAGLADNWWYERELGTLRRQLSSPASMNALLLSKTIVAAVIVTLLTGFMLAVGFLYHGLPLSRFPVALLWMGVSGVLLFTLFSVLKLAFASRKATSVSATIVVFPMMMLGGSFFPFEVMPAWLADIGRASPNGYAVRRLNDYLVHGMSAGELLAGFGFLVPATLLMLALLHWRLRSFARQ